MRGAMFVKGETKLKLGRAKGHDGFGIFDQ